ncbi:MAG TPA: Hsp20/alpha crystallin family protein [Patescibacteria group bacterium]|nr:Hsp20/alpha crystallin family protein [Patescibacteria group bacterium]
MPIIRWEPLNSGRQLWRWPTFFAEEELPSAVTEGLDIFETEDAVVVKAPVPGVPPDEVSVTFEGGVLRIQARHEEGEQERKERKTIYREQRLTSFVYSTTLPRAVDPEKINAEVKDGVVTVTAPIATTAKPKKISVKVSR